MGDEIGEAVVVMLFLVVRVALVGGILLAFPRISRKGLVFGTYVGEALAEGDSVRALRRSWDRSCFALMAVSLLIGLVIAAAGWPVHGNLTGTAVLLGTAPFLYLRAHRRARGLAQPEVARQAQVSTAPLDLDEARGTGFAQLCLVLCALAALATAIYGVLRYEAMPREIPGFAGVVGFDVGLSDKSLPDVLFVPALNFVLNTSFCLVAILIAGAKRSLRGGSGGRSAQAQVAYRTATAHLFAGLALFTCAILTLLSVHMTRIALDPDDGLGAALVVAMLAMIAFALVGLIRIVGRFGQGGALLEEGSSEAPLTGGLADNERWYWGMIYVDRDDPSILVESRFGIGYTMNLGNPRALAILVVYFTLIAALVVLAVAGGVT